MAEYDPYATEFSEHRSGASLNRLIDEPMIHELLLDPQGLRVLDAGCGDGSYARWLAERGAIVTALDASSDLIAIAREQHAHLPIAFSVHDLNEPLVFDVDSFDLVLSTLVTEYVEGLFALFSEFSRVLRSGGRLIFSCDHPLLSGIIKNEKGERVLTDYFSREKRSYSWFSKDSMVFSHTLEDYFAALLRAGFVIDDVREPRPIEEAKDTNPALWERANRIPTIMTVRAWKR